MAQQRPYLATAPDGKPLPSMPATPSSPASRRYSPPGSTHSRSPAPSRLRKPQPAPSHSRAASADHQSYLAHAEPTLPSLQDLQYGAPSPLVPPPPIAADGIHSRSSSVDYSLPGTPNYSRPSTPTLQINGQSPITPSSSMGMGSAEKKAKEKKGLFGRSKKDASEARGPVAWIAGHPERAPYDIQTLLSGRPLPEMWDDSLDGNCYIYLFPRNTPGKGASFKVDSQILASSPVLTKLAFGDVYSSGRQMPLDARTQQLSMNDRMDTMSSDSSRDSRGRLSTLSDNSSQSETHLYLPIKLSSSDPTTAITATPTKSGKKDKEPGPDPAIDDMQTLIDIRNFFAFLIGGPLVATERKASWFQIFMSMAGILKTYEFSNVDGSTYGEIANASFDSYVEELGLGDVRTSREKTIEGIVLGERMKSVLLYNEAFTHAVGKLDDLLGMKSPKYNLISPLTQNRLTRAATDLEKRVASIRLILNDFDFPAIFAGIMNSKQSDEYKEGVRFGQWKDTFMGMRKWTMSTYNQRYGHWPPKASSKKNNLETSGLNRLVLKDVYRDLSEIYDLMVNRHDLTTRTVDGVDRSQRQMEEATVRALRSILSEYDRSSPPVKPPVPFDLPLLPNLKVTRPEYGTGDKKKDLKAIQKRLKDDEIAQLLRATYNGDVVVTPFVEAFRDMERKASHHSTIAELVDLRIGQWIFMYAVLQALPLLACDAPGIKHTKGVEYFLCEPPRSGVPWANANAGAAGGGGSRANTWFSVGEGGNVVSLPSDLVEHSVEGIYRRSHCWVMAEKWSASNPIMNEALHEQEAINATQSAALGDGPGMGVPSINAPDGGIPPPPPSQMGAGGHGYDNSSSSAYGYSNYPPPSHPQHAGTFPNYQHHAPSNYPPGGSQPSSRPNSRPSSSYGGASLGMGMGAPMRNPNRNSSLGIGLEALPLPPGVSPDGRPASPDGRPRSVHAVDANKTFEAILGGVDEGKGKKKKGRK